MIGDLNFSEYEDNEEFELHSEECNVQEIMDCFAKYSDSEMFPYAYCGNFNIPNEITPNLCVLDDEYLSVKSQSEERIANENKVSLMNHQDSKEESKENTQELDLSSKPSQYSNVESTKIKSRDFSLVQISNAIDFKSGNFRWSKQEDIKLFKTLNAICQRLDIDVSRIKLSKGKVNKLHRKLLKSLKIEAGWKGTLIELKDRIIKVRSADKFTAREARVLKRYLSKLADGVVSMEQVLEQFPGKSEEQILEFQYNN